MSRSKGRRTRPSAANVLSHINTQRGITDSTVNLTAEFLFETSEILAAFMLKVKYQLCLSQKCKINYDLEYNCFVKWNERKKLNNAMQQLIINY